jgi:hypothetical protein
MWQRRMAAFLRGKGQILWDVTVNTAYVHPMNILAPGSRNMFNANNKAIDYLYRSLCVYLNSNGFVQRIWHAGFGSS